MPSRTKAEVCNQPARNTTSKGRDEDGETYSEKKLAALFQSALLMSMNFDFEIGKKNEETVKNSGLSRIHEILKQHGCRLEIINKKGEGALVSLLIPRAEITFGEQRVQDDL